MHFWIDPKGDFGFEYFYSLPIYDGGSSKVREDEYDIDHDSDDDSDDGSDDDDKREETVFAWTLNSGQQPTMASGYLGLLRMWHPEEEEEKITGA